MQSLVIGTALVAVATQTLVAGYLADAIAANNRIVRDVRYRLSQLERPQRD